MSHHDLFPCPRRPSAHSHQTASLQSQQVGPHNLDPRDIAFASSQDSQALKYARGTLQFRNQRSRKRTDTGEYVWSDEADIVFVLGLIAWTSNPSNRKGTRRAVFLEQYLALHGFTKNRKQIASRLQVLKGEWVSTSYLDLLKDPDDTHIPSEHRGSSISSPRHHQSPVTQMPAPVPITPLGSSVAPLLHDAEFTRAAGRDCTEESGLYVPFSLPVGFETRRDGSSGDMAGYQPQSHHLHNRTHGQPPLIVPNPTFDVGCHSVSKGIPFNNNFMSYTTAGSRLDVPPNAYSPGIYRYSH